jgi:hypothetical protein
VQALIQLSGGALCLILGFWLFGVSLRREGNLIISILLYAIAFLLFGTGVIAIIIILPIHPQGYAPIADKHIVADPIIFSGSGFGMGY